MTDAAAKHNNNHTSAWWGLRELECGEALKIELEGLQLAIARESNEWSFYYDQAAAQVEQQSSGWWQAQGTIDPDEYEKVARFMFRTTHSKVNMLPALADRPVISSPISALNLPPQEEVTLFVSSPVWLQLYSEGIEEPLLDIPVQRASDTWFGPSTRVGELCYASRTHGHLSLERVPVRLHRAITPVTIRNRADTTLLLERISLPAPNLSLYADDKSQLWTESITLERESDGDMASLVIDKRAPSHLQKPVRLSEPRSRVQKENLAIRAFSVLFD